MTRYLGVIGTGEADAGEAARAYEIGRGAVAAGWVVVTGGLGGVMDGACRGARDGGGVSLAILPRDRAEASPAATYTIPTGLGEMRNALVVRTSEVLVAVGGGWGTLSEIALALRAGVPVVGLGTWELPRAGVRMVGGVDEALAAAREYLP